MTGPTVLLIDSDRDSLAIFSLILRHHGYAVLECDDGESGFELACERRPDLLVFEPYLPAVRGQALPDLLLADPRTSGLAMLVVTSAPTLLERLARGGEPWSEYLVKPCQPGLFLAEVQRRLDATVRVA